MPQFRGRWVGVKRVTAQWRTNQALIDPNEGYQDPEPGDSGGAIIFNASERARLSRSAAPFFRHHHHEIHSREFHVGADGELFARQTVNPIAFMGGNVFLATVRPTRGCPQQIQAAEAR